MKLFRSLKSFFLLQAAAGVLLVLVPIASSTGIVQFHYPRIVDNDPLVSPVKIASLSDSRIVLSDSRIIEDLEWESSSDLVSKSVFCDVEEHGERVVIFVKQRGWLCGTPWTGLICIPLIPDDVPINSRVAIAAGRILTDIDAKPQ